MSEVRTRKWTKEDHEREAAEAVVRSFPEVTIDKMRDAPDADLLHSDGFHVGLEIVRLEDERQATLQKRLRAASQRIQVEMAALHLQGVYEVYYDIQEMFDDEDKRGWDRTVPKRIAAFFAARGAASAEAAELIGYGISRISHIRAKQAPRLFVGCGWSVTTEEGHTLAEIALASKHQKLARYRTNKDNDHFREYWLAMASIGPGTAEDGGFGMLLERRFETSYDRVLLLEHASNARLVGAHDITPVSHSDIAEAAYLRWIGRGGFDAPEAALDDWLAAERDLRRSQSTIVLGLATR